MIDYCFTQFNCFFIIYCKASPSSKKGLRSQSRSPCLKVNQQDYEEVSSSEEHNQSQSYQRPHPIHSLVLSEEKRRGSTSSQDSRTESAGLSQSQVNGFHRNEMSCKTLQTTRQDVIQTVINSINVETPKETDCSDRGDSDMDEATYSSSQEQQSPGKVMHFFLTLLAGLHHSTTV